MRLQLLRPHAAGSLSSVATALALVLLTSAADAAGRSELNQVVVDAAGGFPFTITSPGNYVLTGPIDVPADSDGFVLMTNEVVFDLNGFSIAGPATCNTTSCPSGIGMAIRGFSGIAHARRTTVRNGTIRGFGSSCIQLGSQSHVENLLVTECGRTGISVSSGSIVTQNRVLQTGESGISMNGLSHPPTYAHNTVAASGLGGGGQPAVAGGHPSAGNSCDDGSCTPSGKKRFYLTENRVDGAGAASACDAGFRIAAVNEIRDFEALHYDTNKGLSDVESGSGPPTGLAGIAETLAAGWLRTGIPGGGPAFSCESFTSASNVETGYVGQTVFPPFILPNAGEDWAFNQAPCNQIYNVWCIED